VAVAAVAATLQVTQAAISIVAKSKMRALIIIVDRETEEEMNVGAVMSMPGE
jgi:hypothetical protein